MLFESTMEKIAVIGAGVGGCCAAYFARKYLLGSKVTVYEAQNRLSGRVLTYRGNKIQKELGAEFFNFSNPLVSHLIRELGLETQKLEDTMDLAVWNGNEVVFQSGQALFYKFLGLVNRFKLGVPKLVYNLKKAERQIKKLYKQQQKGPAEFWELFEHIGLDNWYKMPFNQILVEMGVDKSFIDEMVTPITRIIYSQNAEIGGFAGLSSLLGAYQESMYSLQGGNDVLPKRLLQASSSKVRLGCKVKSVEKTSTGSFRVLSEDDASVFDGVLVAAPLEVADIAFDGVEAQKSPQRDYQRIYIRVMKGAVDSRYFGLNASSRLPSTILTSKKADAITRFSVSESKGSVSP